MDEALHIIESLLTQNTENLSQLAMRVKSDELKSDCIEERQLISILTQTSKEEKNFILILEGCVQWCYLHNVKIIKTADLKTKQFLEISARLEETWLEKLKDLMMKPREKANELQCIYLVRSYSFLLDTNVLWKFYVNLRKDTLISLFDRSLESDSAQTARELICTVRDLVENDTTILQEIVLQSDVIDVYYDVLIDHVERTVKQIEPTLTTNHSLDSCSRVESDSKEAVLLSLNEEVDSINSSPERPPMFKIVQMIKFCAQFEKHLKTRSTRQWDWRSIFVRIGPEICRWIEKQIRAASFPCLEQDFCHFEIVENLTDLSVACKNELTLISNSVSVALKQFSTDGVNYLLRLSQSKQKDVLYTLLNTVSSFCNVLQKAHSVLEGSEIVCLPSESLQLMDLSSSLMEQITFLHKCRLLSGIFHDAESHDWQNEKPFFEDEKVSFAIQMWCLHMRTLRSELSACQPIYARQIFCAILCFSLSWFAQRYARAKPSSSRVTQFKSDITTILLNASEFILTCARGTWINDSSLMAVHEYCNSLLITMIVVCAPLHMLRNICENGLLVSKTTCDVTEWLNILLPDLKCDESIDICVKSISNQFEPHFPTLVKLLVINDSQFPITIINHHLSVETKANSSINIVQVVFDALILCETFPFCIGSLLIQLIKKCNHWEEILWFCSHDKQLPLWIQTLDDLLQEYCVPIVTPIFFKLLQFRSVQAFNDCAVTNQISSGITNCYKLDMSAIADQLLDHSISIFSTLPLPIQLYFAQLQKELPESEKSRLVTESVYLHVITMKCCRLLNSYLKKVSDVMDCQHLTDNLLQNIRTKGLWPIADLLSNKMIVERSAHRQDDYTIAATQMMSDVRASNSLRQLHKYILINRDLVANLVTDAINPLNQSTDQTGKLTFDWQSILPPKMALKEITLRLLLANRWEMKNDQQLDNVQQDQVRILKSLCGLNDDDAN